MRDAHSKHVACKLAALLIRQAVADGTVATLLAVDGADIEAVTGHLTDLCAELDKRSVATPRKTQTRNRRAGGHSYVD